MISPIAAAPPPFYKRPHARTRLITFWGAVRREASCHETRPSSSSPRDRRRRSVSSGRDEAERLLLESLRIRRTHFDGDHPGIATNLNNLAHVAAEKPDFKAAERYQQQALDMDRRLLGEDHRYVATSMTLVGIFRLADGRVAEAEAPLRDGVALMRRVMGDDHLAVAPGLYGLGKYLAASEKFEEGEHVAREVIRVRKAGLPEGHWEIGLSETLLGEILAGQGRDAEAEPLLVNGFEIVSAQPIGSRNRTEARERVVRFFLSRGQPERAAKIKPQPQPRELEFAQPWATSSFARARQAASTRSATN